jgi:hypothetical protein
MFISKMFEACFEIFLSLSLSPSFLFAEIRWQKEEEKYSEKRRETSKEAQPNLGSPPSTYLSPTSVRQGIERLHVDNLGNGTAPDSSPFPIKFLVRP